MQLTKPVDGTDYYVRACKVSEIREILKLDDEMEMMAKLAQVCTTFDGNPLWPTIEAANNADWPIVQRCAMAAMEVNGMGGDDSGN